MERGKRRAKSSGREELSGEVLLIVAVRFNYMQHWFNGVINFAPSRRKKFFLHATSIGWELWRLVERRRRRRRRWKGFHVTFRSGFFGTFPIFHPSSCPSCHHEGKSPSRKSKESIYISLNLCSRHRIRYILWWIREWCQGIVMAGWERLSCEQRRLGLKGSIVMLSWEKSANNWSWHIKWAEEMYAKNRQSQMLNKSFVGTSKTLSPLLVEDFIWRIEQLW